MQWDPQQYGHWADERSRPFFDLVNRVTPDQPPRRVVDLGCGPGSLTATLADRWPGAIVEGLDSSPEMIDAARSLETRATFRLGDIAGYAPGPDVDVLVSNAALQWVPGHVDLVRSWLVALADHAWIGFQVPGNFGSPSHVLMRELAESPRWRDQVGDVLRHHTSVLEPGEYAALMLRAGWIADVWETTYLHVLPGPDPVLDWVRGTGLRPVLAALGPADAAEFTARFAAELRTAYPAGPGGTVFGFRRIFVVGRRAQ